MLETELFEFLEGATDGSFNLCQQGEILSWNPAAERLFGSSSSEAPGKSCYQILHGRDALGTQVSHERCRMLECTAVRTGDPKFKSVGAALFGRAIMGRYVHRGVAKPTEPKSSGDSSGT